jgi:UDP-MurNAc hydroxylase
LKVTFIGHAGLFVETAHGSVLCDPWFNPVYFASWFPFPSNEGVDLSKIKNPTYLYVSHLHDDHFDATFLREHISKETTVLLPAFPLDHLERALRDLGFTKFLHTKNSQPFEVDGLRFMLMALTGPNGALGDSSLMVDDGEVRIFDQNDAKLVDMDTLKRFGPYDVHFIQFSGAIWYPMVYKMPEKMKQAVGRKKHDNQFDRAMRYIKQLGPSFVVPSAGPPCFLDDELFDFNDFDRDPANIFPDQTVFLDHMRSQGVDNGRLMIPGSVAEIREGACDVTHPLPEEEVVSIFTHKRAYLEDYKARKQPLIEEIKASWPQGQVDILSSLRDWIEPLLEQADIICVGVNGRLLLDCEREAVVIDFQQRRVYEWHGEEWEYCFRVPPALVEYCILNRIEDWVNQLFLSCRFEAERRGAYNDYLYVFFKCLSEERIQYAEGWYAEQSHAEEFFECDGYRVQRRCPHLRADLTRFGEVENGILTCTLHDWQFDLATGHCLTSGDRRLYTERISREEPMPVGAAAGVEGQRKAS